MKWGVIRFPGSLDDLDAMYGLRDVMGQDVTALWHKDESLRGAECVVLPGGFSYGDHLRCGAIARFSPIMKSVAKFAADGGLVIGICNGFQILTEAHLLPGALTRNRTLSFICDRVHLRVENAKTPFTCTMRAGDILALPIKHGEGCYVAPEKELLQMEERGQVILRYVDANGDATDAANLNGSMRSIAGVANERFNVFGLMPHPEHAVEASLFGADGLKIFQSVIGFEMQKRSGKWNGESSYGNVSEMVLVSTEGKSKEQIVAEAKRGARRLGLLKNDRTDET